MIKMRVYSDIDVRHGGMFCLMKMKIWHDFIDDFIDDEDDNDYYQRLYKTGEIFEVKKFSKIELRPWMIFLDKGHFKETLKDYYVQAHV